AAQGASGACTGGVGPPRHAGAGLPGAHPGRGRVPPRRSTGGRTMSSGTITPDRTRLEAGRDGFARLLRAEWTKFRTVRGWVIGMLATPSAIVGLGLAPGLQGSV